MHKKNPWMEHTGYKEHYKEQIITMKILVYRLTFRENPLRLYYYDSHTGYITETTTLWLQTNQNSTSDYDTQFSNQCDRCKMLKVVHGNQSDNHCIWSDKQLSIPQLHIYIYNIIQYYSSTRKHPKFSLPCLACTNTHSFVVLCFKIFAFVLENQSNKIISDTDSLTNCWFFAGIIYMFLLITFICWS